MALVSRQNLVFTQSDRMRLNFVLYIIIDEIYVGIVNLCLSQNCNRVTAIDLLQNLVFTQNLENKWTERDQILYTHHH